MRSLSDLQKRILTEEYPHISLDHDSDVERYFDLRRSGRQTDALNLYNSKIIQKYPKAEQRKLLIQYYRSNDPRFAEILQESLVELADRLLNKTRYIISLLSKDIDTVNLSDAYAVIRLAENLLAVISPDRYAAIGFAEKYARYAKLLNFQEVQMERTAELIRLYVTETLDSVQELKKEREERRRKTLRKRIEGRRFQPNFNVSQIVFSAEDINKILIPSGITRIEDQVIAYALKYWNKASDPSFEKIIVLYSKKYHTQHADIYQAVKNGRDHAWKDEEILNAVLATVVKGYYYSISGDAYLQRTWARYKQNLAPAPEAEPLPAETESRTVPRSPKRPYTRKAPANKRRLPSKIRKQGKTAAAAGIAQIGSSSPKKETRSTHAYSKHPTRKGVRSFIPEDKALRNGYTRAVPEAHLSNSISDMIKKMTGKTYTVYKELFFKNVRPAIRSVLSASSSRKGLFFDAKQNDAEELVYQFLFAHYNDPYQNWQQSSECKKLSDLGYNIPEIEPIIQSWMKTSALQ